MSDYIRQFSSNQSEFKDGCGWVILSSLEAGIKKKIEDAGTVLKNWDISIYRGILTGYNEAFIINKETKEKLIAASPKNAEIIRPILKGRSIKKYAASINEWIIFIPFGWTNRYRKSEEAEAFFKKNFPDIYDHLIEKSKLSTKGKGLFNRDDQGEYWWELRPCKYVDEFKKEKIIYIDIMTDNEAEGYPFPCFTFSRNEEMVLNTAYFIGGDTKQLKWILAILNSKVGRFIVRNYVTQLQQRQFRLFQQNVETFPIVTVKSEFEDELIRLIDSAVNKKTELNLEIIESKINEIVYKLYDLNSVEINELEGFTEF